MSFKTFCIAIILCVVAAPLSAASLAECEKVKLQQLKAERGAKSKGGKKAGAGNRGPSRSRQAVEQFEEWLWKNCSNYAHELRNLEQGRM